MEIHKWDHPLNGLKSLRSTRTISLCISLDAIAWKHFKLTDAHWWRSSHVDFLNFLKTNSIPFQLYIVSSICPSLIIADDQVEWRTLVNCKLQRKTYYKSDKVERWTIWLELRPSKCTWFAWIYAQTNSWYSIFPFTHLPIWV